MTASAQAESTTQTGIIYVPHQAEDCLVEAGTNGDGRRICLTPHFYLVSNSSKPRVTRNNRVLDFYRADAGADTCLETYHPAVRLREATTVQGVRTVRPDIKFRFRERGRVPMSTPEVVRISEDQIVTDQITLPAGSLLLREWLDDGDKDKPVWCALTPDQQEHRNLQRMPLPAEFNRLSGFSNVDLFATTKVGYQGVSSVHSHGMQSHCVLKWPEGPEKAAQYDDIVYLTNMALA